MTKATGFFIFSISLFKKVRRGGGAYLKAGGETYILIWPRGRHLFEGGHLLEHGHLFKEIR